MLLSIIIPYHKETKEQINSLMISLNEQVGIDFNNIEILLCNDIKEEAPLDNEFFIELKNISSRIKHLKSPYENNPGLSRQFGIDNARGEYVFFCDADDCLYHIGVLRELEENINNSNADIYMFKFLEEIGNTNSNIKQYTIQEFNYIWVFAKAYKVDFLRKNHIRFSTKLKYHEDSYFNLCCKYANPKMVPIKSSPAYLWKYSNYSITRVNNHAYTFTYQWEYICAMDEAYMFIKNELKKDFSSDVYRVLAQVYNVLINPYFRKEEKEYVDGRNKLEETFVKFILKYIPETFEHKLNSSQLQTIQFNLLTYKDSSFLPDKSFYEVIDYLNKKYMTD